MYYLYELSYRPRKDVCDILNRNGGWEELADKFNMNYDEILDLKMKQNHTESLLEKMGTQLKTIEDLLIRLSEMKQDRCCRILINHIPSLSHCLDIHGNPSHEIAKPISEISNSMRQISIPIPESFHSISVEQNDLCREARSIAENGKDLFVSVCESKQNNNVGIKIHAVSKPSPEIVRAIPESFRSVSVERNNFSRETWETHCESKQNNVGIDDMVSTSWDSFNNALYQKMSILTESFSTNYIIANGEFGKIYKATYLGQLSVIKTVDKKIMNTARGHQYYRDYIRILSKFHHPNILLLMDHSICNNTMYLLLENMQNDNLRNCLDKSSNLSSSVRHTILINIACAILYLHEHDDKHSLIYGNLKSSNVLIGINNVAKISDFELSCEIDRQNDSSFIVENTGQRAFYDTAYMSDSFLENGKLSVFTDAFAFGVVTLEMLTNLPPKGDILLRNRLMDIREGSSNYQQQCLWYNQSWNDLFSLSLKCFGAIPNQLTFIQIEKELSNLQVSSDNTVELNDNWNISINERNSLSCSNYVHTERLDSSWSSFDNFDSDANAKSNLKNNKKLTLFDD